MFLMIAYRFSGIQIAETSHATFNQELIVKDAYEETQFVDDEGYEEDINFADLVPLPRNSESLFGRDY